MNTTRYLNPLTPISDHFFLLYQYNIKQTSDENKERFTLGVIVSLSVKLLQVSSVAIRLITIMSGKKATDSYNKER